LAFNIKSHFIPGHRDRESFGGGETGVRVVEETNNKETIKTNDDDPFWPNQLYLNFIFSTPDSPSSFFEGFGASYPL